jgi:hypothetical protein
MPEYQLLLELVRAGSMAEVSLEGGQVFSAKMLARKGLAESCDGNVLPTVLGKAAARARRGAVDGVAIYFTASDLAAAAALADQPPGES